MRNIVVYGAGSYGQEIACLIEKINSRNTIPGTEWKFVGFFDDNEKLKGEDLGYGTILGGRDVLNDWDSSLAVVIAIANTSIIKNILSGICNERVYFPNIVDPDTSFLDRKSCRMGQGNVIGEGCRFSPKVSIGDFNIVVNDSVFGHDVVMGSYNVLFPEVRLSGYVKVGDSNLFGVRTAILQGFSVGSNVRIASGSILMNDAQDGFVYRGNPARKMAL